MRRRRFLTLTAASFGLVSGCSDTSDSNTPTQTNPATESHTDQSTSRKQTEPETETPEDSTTEQEPTEEETEQERSTLVVSPTGSDENAGTSESPLGSIQEALDRAEPGTTISLQPGVHTTAEPGRPVGITRRSGTPDAPIRITGPPEAIVRGPPTELSSKPLFHIIHSHVHIDGITLNGLTKPTEAENHRWYRPQLVLCSPPTWKDSYPDYLTNVKIKPRAVGNARKKLISAYRANRLEIGEFEIIGPAGVGWFHGEQTGYVLGSIVSLGRSSNNFGKPHYPWEGPDESHDIRVHHIANLEEHRHTELVVTHSGNHDVTIEYCTDTGGMTRSGVHLAAAQSKVRWCEFTNSPENGVSVTVPPMKERGSYEAFSTIPEKRFPGRNNNIYGNKLVENEGGWIGFSSPEWIENGLEQQGTVCGNITDRETASECPASVPHAETIGYTGGDSPWMS
jgi:hypothetical protein